MAFHSIRGYYMRAITLAGEALYEITCPLGSVMVSKEIAEILAECDDIASLLDCDAFAHDSPFKRVWKVPKYRNLEVGFAYWADRQELLDPGEWAELPPMTTVSPLVDECGNHRHLIIQRD